MTTVSADYVEQFLQFTGTVDAETATAFIRGNNNNLEAAVGAYYDNPDPSVYVNANKWDDAPFRQDRSGGNTANQLVPYDEALGYGAPSRPPSRTNVRAEHVEYGPMPQPTIWEGEAEALRQSQMEQETGILDSSGREYVPDVELDGLKRRDDAPAFIKPAPNQELISSLMTILQAIPGFRSRMLTDFDTLGDYGYNDEWWKGQDIETGRIVDSTDEQHADGLKVLHELQRLLAFLEKTNRSYGSVGSLLRMAPFQNDEQSDQRREKASFASFVETLDYLAMQHTRSASVPMFLNRAAEHKGDEEVTEANVACFQVDLAPLTHNQTDKSLHRALEHLFWAHDVWLHDLSPIILLQVKQTLPLTDIRIPHQLFMDQYHVGKQEMVKITQAELSRLDSSHTKINKRLTKLKTLGTTRGNVEAMAMLEGVVKFLRKGQEEPSEDVHIPSSATSTRARQLLTDLEKAHDHIRELLDAAEKEIEASEARFKEARSRLTDASVEGEYKPEYGYTLVGVAISPNDKKSTTYVKQSLGSANANEGYPAAAASDAIQDQWWKILYDFSKTPADARTIRVEESHVLGAPGNNRGEALLVYANDEMLQGHEAIHVPESLTNFVETDNRALQAETAADKTGGNGMLIDLSEDDDAINVSPLNATPPASDMDVDHIEATVIEGQEPIVDPTMMGGNDIPEKAAEIESVAKQTRSDVPLTQARHVDNAEKGGPSPDIAHYDKGG